MFNKIKRKQKDRFHCEKILKQNLMRDVLIETIHFQEFCFNVFYKKNTILRANLQIWYKIFN